MRRLLAVVTLGLFALTSGPSWASPTSPTEKGSCTFERGVTRCVSETFTPAEDVSRPGSAANCTVTQSVVQVTTRRTAHYGTRGSSGAQAEPMVTETRTIFGTPVETCSALEPTLTLAMVTSEHGTGLRVSAQHLLPSAPISLVYTVTDAAGTRALPAGDWYRTFDNGFFGDGLPSACAYDLVAVTVSDGRTTLSGTIAPGC